MEFERLTNSMIGGNSRISAEEREIPHAVGTHWHEFYELELILEGTGDYLINGVRHEIKKGMIFFMTPVDFHCVHPGNGCAVRLMNIMFEGHFLPPDFLPYLLDAKVQALACGPADFSLFHFLIQRLIRERKTRPFLTEQYTVSLLSCILIEYLRQTGVMQEKGSCGPISQAMQYMHLHFKEDLTLAEAAKQVNFSPAYFSEVFHHTAGRTFKQYLLELRFAYVQKLLQHTDLTVTEICYGSGFNSLPHFLRAYKKRYGQSPGSFRKSKIQTGFRQSET